MSTPPRIRRHEPPFQDPSRRARHAAAAVPVRADQRAALQQAAGRRRRDRPGHGQPVRSAGGVRHREAGRGGPRSAQPRLQQVERHRQPAPRGGGEVLQAVRRAARSRRGSHRLPGLEGRLQPHVPGDDGAGRHGDRAGAVFSDPRVFGGAGVGQCDRAGSSRQRQVPVEHRVHVRASLPAAEAA